MTNPCQIGLKCPYSGYDEDGDLLCTWPKILKECDEDEVFGFADTVDCQILDYPSLLSDFILLKDSIERCSYPTETRIQAEKNMQEFEKHCEEGNKRVNRKTNPVLYRRGITEEVSQNCGITEGEAETVLDYLRHEVSKVKLEEDGE